MVWDLPDEEVTSSIGFCLQQHPRTSVGVLELGGQSDMRAPPRERHGVSSSLVVEQVIAFVAIFLTRRASEVQLPPTNCGNSRAKSRDM